MKDILLRRSSANTYDWAFDGVDVETVTGDMQLIQACKHAVLLRPGELEQEVYKDKGCTIYDYLLRENHEYIAEEKEAAIEESIMGVHNVRNVQCTLTEVDQFANKINVDVMTEDFKVVTIDEI